MTYEETIKLIDAGYTKEEINAFESKQSGAAKTEDEPKNETVNNPKTETKTEVNEVNAMNSEVFKDLINSVKELKDTVKAIQDNAAKTAKVETPVDSNIENLIADFTKNM